jgi:hypothetical protein
MLPTEPKIQKIQTKIEIKLYGFLCCDIQNVSNIDDGGAGSSEALVPMPLAYWCRVPDDINAGSTGTA